MTQLSRRRHAGVMGVEGKNVNADTHLAEARSQSTGGVSGHRVSSTADGTFFYALKPARRYACAKCGIFAFRNATCPICDIVLLLKIRIGA